MDVLRSLRQVQTLVAPPAIKYLNRGGCGVFAALVGRELQSNGVKPEVIVQTEYGDDPLYVRQRVRNPLDPFDWHDNGLYINHAGLRFKHNGKWWTYDSTALRQSHDVFSDDDRPASRGFLTVEEMEAFAFPRAKGPFHTVYDLWNSEFDRRQIPKLRRAVHEGFKQA